MSYMISLVGGGGKTTTMYYLAKEYEKKGKKIIVCTSTHIGFPENNENIFFISKAKELESVDIFNKANIAILGKEKIIQNDITKISGIDAREISLLKNYADIILVEADGAKRLPLKVPSEKEPVIPDATDEVIACVGIDALGEKAKEKCFRFEIAKELYSWVDYHIINEKDIARIMTDKRAGLKNAVSLKKRFLINKVDNEMHLSHALKIRDFIQEICIEENIKNYEINIVSYKNGFGLINI